MNRMTKIIAVGLLILLGLALLASPVLAQSNNNCKEEVVGGACRLRSGNTLERLSILGGAVTLDEGSVIRGNVSLAGGALEVSGEVKGNITAMGGTVNLTDTARVRGNVTTFGAALRQSDKAVVEGKVVSQSPGGLSLPFSLPEIPLAPQAPVAPLAPSLPQLPGSLGTLGVTDALGAITKLLWWFFSSLAVSALALLVVLLLPNPTRRVGQTVATQPAVAGGMGCLTILVVTLVSFLLIITIILSPIGLLGILLLLVAALFGWLALGFEVGQRLARMLRSNWADPVSAALGTLLLSLVAGAADWIACVGWLVPALIVILGLGGVAISRFGARGPAVPPDAWMAAPPVPPQPPVPPSALYAIPQQAVSPAAPIEVPTEPPIAAEPIAPQSQADNEPAPESSTPETPAESKL